MRRNTRGEIVRPTIPATCAQCGKEIMGYGRSRELCSFCVRFSRPTGRDVPADQSSLEAFG